MIISTRRWRIRQKLRRFHLFTFIVSSVRVQLHRIKGLRAFAIYFMMAGLFTIGMTTQIPKEAVICTSVATFDDMLGKLGCTLENDYFELEVEVTAYTNGPESTGKKPGHPAYGITSSGHRAGWGTVAAPEEFPYGVELEIPGYGMGKVLDRGGAIKWYPDKQKYVLDVWMEDVEQARKWGRRTLTIKVYRSGLSIHDENRILRRGK